MDSAWSESARPHGYGTPWGNRWWVRRWVSVVSRFML